MSPRETLPGQPVDEAGAPVFAAPWQAKAFALVVHLHERGLFSWPDWAAALARACEGQGPGPDGYYQAWVEALAALLAERGLAGAGEVAAMAEAWARAAEATPHGRPILLDAGLATVLAPRLTAALRPTGSPSVRVCPEPDPAGKQA